ncbi:hypothetical protein HY504_00275 [Candidatus Wolfebacteria bacterium]|nr:hypothetical protein [Candidatus Wolfebacteria bacterium]
MPLVGYVFFGFLHSADLGKEIRNSLNIDQKIADSIAAEIEKKIFAPIRSELKKLYQPVAGVVKEKSESENGTSERQVEVPAPTAQDSVSQVPESAPTVQVVEPKPVIVPLPEPKDDLGRESAEELKKKIVWREEHDTPISAETPVSPDSVLDLKKGIILEKEDVILPDQEKQAQFLKGAGSDKTVSKTTPQSMRLETSLGETTLDADSRGPDTSAPRPSPLDQRASAISLDPRQSASNIEEEEGPVMLHKEAESTPVSFEGTKRSLGGLFGFFAKKEVRMDEAPIKAEIEVPISADQRGSISDSRGLDQRTESRRMAQMPNRVEQKIEAAPVRPSVPEFIKVEIPKPSSLSRAASPITTPQPSAFPDSQPSATPPAPSTELTQSKVEGIRTGIKVVHYTEADLKQPATSDLQLTAHTPGVIDLKKTADKEDGFLKETKPATEPRPVFNPHNPLPSTQKPSAVPPPLPVPPLPPYAKKSESESGKPASGGNPPPLTSPVIDNIADVSREVSVDAGRLAKIFVPKQQGADSPGTFTPTAPAVSSTPPVAPPANLPVADDEVIDLRNL